MIAEKQYLIRKWQRRKAKIEVQIRDNTKGGGSRLHQIDAVGTTRLSHIDRGQIKLREKRANKTLQIAPLADEKSTCQRA